ncbi:MAG: hypothetical protein DMG13_05695 [Acidobacteria bacterium]|nr:MAG: hypothetical protein DMG13_05695 [Acidobacteriota bacterium]
MDRLVLPPALRREAILELMRSAEQRLALSMFRCDDLAVVDEVAAAVKRNVNVRVLITHRARGWKRRLVELGALLESTGAHVQRYTGPLMKYHAKYVVADDGPALVSSLNFTRKCFEATCDFLLFSDDPLVISGLNVIFEHDFSSPGSPLPEITDRLIVGPDHARMRFKNLLDEAESSIRIIDHRVIDPQMLSLLREKQNGGVSVRVLGHGPMNGLVSHGRMALVDGRVAVIGSIHLSPPSLDCRREVAILVHEPSIVHELNEFFESLALDRSNLVSLSETPNPPPEDEEDDEDDENYAAVET